MFLNIIQFFHPASLMSRTDSVARELNLNFIQNGPILILSGVELNDSVIDNTRAGASRCI
jgi:hypothetical protein